MMIDKVINALQLALPLLLLIKSIVTPYIYKHVKIKSNNQFTGTEDVKRFIHKRRNETNELHTITLFLYSMLAVWLNWPKLLELIESSLNDIGIVGNYIGAIIEIGFLVVLQLHMYKYGLMQRMNVGESISKISIYKSNNEKLVRDIYAFLMVEVFLQASIVGLIPFSQIDRFIYVDATVVLVAILAFIHALLIQKTIHSYSHQHVYLRSWTTFICASIFANAANALLSTFEGFLNMPYDSMSIVMWLLLRTIWLIASLTQLSCLAVNLIQRSSMEEWYND